MKHISSRGGKGWGEGSSGIHEHWSYELSRIRGRRPRSRSESKRKLSYWLKPHRIHPSWSPLVSRLITSSKYPKQSFAL
ncbi:hypothetical protein KC19_8G031700 [Ceratodon purpureus]|uniref:Uncharacterized protein n=1 Tax=Ceratodon purpureus TaxID=3225 RepID=A0A8T0GWN3_CERPU|nr:hypothetical protein KC19_8G031700 [Ceratodon purpureus]